MDSILGRVIQSACIALCVFMMALVPEPARAADVYTHAQAMAFCAHERDDNNAELSAAGSTLRWKCEDVSDPGGLTGSVTDVRCGWGGSRDCDITGGYWPYKADQPPKNPCDGIPSVTTNFQGALADGFSVPQPRKQDDGSTVCCASKLHKLADPVMGSNGIWTTYGTLSATGNICGFGDGDGGGWQAPDGSKPPDPAPPAPPPLPPKGDPPKNDPPPRTCGDLSCYDPKTNEYCTQGSSGMLCTKGPPDGGGPGGSCSSSGDQTICSGRPQAPPPPAGKVPDPPTATQGTDRYTRSEGDNGDQRYQVTTTVYNNGTGGASSGAKPNDSKPSKPGGGGSGGDPAPGGSTGGSGGGSGDDSKKKDDGTGANGGGDCNNPPSVTGSAALGMVAMQAWKTRCASEQLHTDLTGDGKSSPGDITKPSGDSAWVDTPGTGDSLADNANKGIYDTSGMGFGTACPMHDLDVALWDGRSFAIPFSKGCEVGVWIRMFVLAFAAFAAAKITAGSRS